MPYVTTAPGVAIHYESFGEGRPILLLHGWCMSSAVWKYQLEALQAHYRVVVCDLRGHGESTGGGEITVPHLAGDIATLLQELDLHDVCLIGWSLGAQVALETVRGCDRISQLVLVGGTPRFTADEGWENGLPADEARGMALRVRRQYVPTMEDFFRRMFAPGELSSEGYAAIVRDVVKAGRLPTQEIAQKALSALVAADLREVACNVTCPTLLVHGTEDIICLPSASEWLAAHIPGARLHLFEGVGHAPFLSRPREFNLLVEQFASCRP